MTTSLIGGDVCSEPLEAGMLPAEPRKMTKVEIDDLWRIFAAIGEEWRNIGYNSTGLRSSWLEFVTERCVRRPSYVEEYVNALAVVRELESLYPEAGFRMLFFKGGASGEDGDVGDPHKLHTRLAHAKHFVVDEFIKVQIVAGGYRNFIRPPEETHLRPENTVNNNAFVSTSRYNRIKPVRTYEGDQK